MSINPQIIVISFSIATAIGIGLTIMIIVVHRYATIEKWLKNYGYAEMLWSRTTEFFVSRLSFMITYKDGRHHIIANLPLLLSCTIDSHRTKDRAIEHVAQLRGAIQAWLSTHCKPRIVWWEVV